MSQIQSQSKLGKESYYIIHWKEKKVYGCSGCEDYVDYIEFGDGERWEMRLLPRLVLRGVLLPYQGSWIEIRVDDVIIYDNDPEDVAERARKMARKVREIVKESKRLVRKGELEEIVRRIVEEVGFITIIVDNNPPPPKGHVYVITCYQIYVVSKKPIKRAEGRVCCCQNGDRWCWAEDYGDVRRVRKISRIIKLRYY